VDTNGPTYTQYTQKLTFPNLANVHKGVDSEGSPTYKYTQCKSIVLHRNIIICFQDRFGYFHKIRVFEGIRDMIRAQQIFMISAICILELSKTHGWK
jgi:hypothetical protein